MRLSAITLRKRILIAIAALAVIHAAFYAVPRCIATYPRFDERAYNEAVAILKEEVGAAAVDNGTFSIPRVPIALPYCGEARVFNTDHAVTYNTLLIRGGSARLLSYYFRHFDGFVWERKRLKVAALSEEKAHEIYSVTSYLYSIRSPASDVDRVDKSNLRRVRYQDLTLRDATWLRRCVDRNELVLGEPATLQRLVSDACAARYAAAIPAMSDIPWSTNPQELEPAVVESLRACVPAACYADEFWTFLCAGQVVPVSSLYALPLVSTPDALPMLNRIASIRAARSSRWLPTLPLIGRYFEPRPGERQYDLPDVANVIWMIRTMEGRSPAERVDIAARLAFDPAANPDRRRLACQYLQYYAPQRYVDLYLDRLSSFSEGERKVHMMFYEEKFGTDQRVARQAMTEKSTALRAHGCLALYRITGDQEFLNEVYRLAAPDLGVNDGNAHYAAYLLALAYRDGVDVGDLLGSFRQRPDAATDPVIFGLLADYGDGRDFRILAGIVARTDVPGPRGMAAEMMVRLRDPEAADILVGYLDAGPHNAERALEARVIATVANAATPACLACLERLYARELQGPARSAPIPTVPPEPNRQPVDQMLIQDPTALTPLELLERSILECRCRMAARPIDFMLALQGRGAELIASEAIEILADKYSVEELQAFLADGQYAPLRGQIWGAMFKARHPLSQRGTAE